MSDKSAGLGRRREHKIFEIGKNQPKSADRGGGAQPSGPNFCRHGLLSDKSPCACEIQIYFSLFLLIKRPCC
jgi:hypothetical protein